MYLLLQLALTTSIYMLLLLLLTILHVHFVCAVVGLDSKQLSRLPDPGTRRELVERSMLKTYRPKSDDVEESKPCMALLLPEQVKPGCVEGFLGGL